MVIIIIINIGLLHVLSLKMSFTAFNKTMLFIILLLTHTKFDMLLNFDNVN